MYFYHTMTALFSFQKADVNILLLPDFLGHLAEVKLCCTLVKIYLILKYNYIINHLFSISFIFG